MDLCRHPCACHLCLVPTWRPQEAAAQEIEACAAKHLVDRKFKALLAAPPGAVHCTASAVRHGVRWCGRGRGALEDEEG